MNEIVASVKRVADIVAEISAASEEQSAGIDQVNTAVTQMDSVTQQNAALVEEAAAASKSMEQQGQVLVEDVAFFRVNADRSADAAMPEWTDSADRTADVRQFTPNATVERRTSIPGKGSAHASRLRATG